MEQEVKFVSRSETFTDVAVRELGKNRAACFCRIQFKRCKKSACATCPQHIKIENCRKAMSDYDRLRLDSYTADFYVDYSKNPMGWMNHREYVRYFTRFMLILLGFIFAMLFPLFCYVAML